MPISDQDVFLNYQPHPTPNPTVAGGLGMTLNGTGAPSASQGNNGDTYVNLTNGDIYRKFGGSWVISSGGEGDITVQSGGSLAAARDQAVSGQLIIVKAGTYTMTTADGQLFKSGVNWYFNPGAIVNFTNTRVTVTDGIGYGIFDDRLSGAVSCTIDGYGEFYFDGGTPTYDPNTSLPTGNNNVKGAVVITNALSTVYFRAKSIRLRAWMGAGMSGVFIQNATLVVVSLEQITENTTGSVVVGGEVSLLLGLDSGSAPVYATNAAVGLWWQEGECYTNVKQINCSFYGLYGAQNAAGGASNWWHTSERIRSQSGAATIYILGDSTGSANWRTWVDVKEAINEGANNAAAYSVAFRGSHYVRAEKMSSSGSVVVTITSNASTAPKVWITAQKLTMAGTGNGVTVSGATAGEYNLDVLQIEDTNAMAIMISLSGGSTLLVRGGSGKVLNGKGAVISGGLLGLSGLRIDTSNTNSATNRPCEISGGTLILRNALLVAPALADSIYAATAKTVAVYGVAANKDKNANITLGPNGGFTVDILVI